MSNTGFLRAALALAPVLVAGVAHAGATMPMPGALVFPQTGTDSQSKSMQVQFVNTSNAAVTVEGLAIAGMHAADFAIVNPPGLPIGLSPGVGLPVDVVFAPKNGGMRVARLQVQVRGEMATTDCVLNGTGVGPKITAAPSPATVGGVLFGQQVPPLAMTVSNEGGAKVTVSAVVVTGPDAPRFALAGLPNLPVTLAPLEKFVFQLGYAPAMPGNAIATMEVHSDDPMTPKLATMIVGQAGDPKIAVAPATILFGNQRVGQPSVDEEVVITNTGFSDLKVTGIQLAGNHPGEFKLTPPMTPLTLKVGQTAKARIAFSPTIVGARDAVIAIASDDPKTPARNVVLSGTGTTPMTMLDTGTVDFGTIRVGTIGSGSFTLRNNGSGPVRVATMVLGGAHAAAFQLGLMAPFTVAAGSSTPVQVTFRPQVAQKHDAAVSFTTDDPKLGNGSVVLVGTAVSPVIDVDPMSITFGEIEVGTTSEPEMLSMRNTGNTTLTISRFNQTGSMVFSFAPPLKAPLTLMPGQSTAFAVTYRPVNDSGDMGQLVLSTDDPARVSVVVGLRGNGASPSLEVDPHDGMVLDFDKVIVGLASSPKVIKIMNPGGADLRIKAIVITADEPGMASAFSVDLSKPFVVPSKESTSASVTFTPTMPKEYKATLEIQPESDALSPVMLTLHGEGSAPTISVTTTTMSTELDFGKVEIGKKSPPLGIRVLNGGLQVQPVMVIVEPSAFATESKTVMIQAGGRATFPVTFTPDAPQPFAGKVTVLVPGGVTPLATVGVKGEGIAAEVMVMRPTGCGIGRARSAPVGFTEGLLLVVGSLLALRRRGRARR